MSQSSAPSASDPPASLRHFRGERNFGDTTFRYVTAGFAALLIAVLLLMGYEMWLRSLPSIREFGLPFIWSQEWDPVREAFGALPFIYGTLLSSLVALTI